MHITNVLGAAYQASFLVLYALALMAIASWPAVRGKHSLLIFACLKLASSAMSVTFTLLWFTQGGIDSSFAMAWGILDALGNLAAVILFVVFARSMRGQLRELVADEER